VTALELTDSRGSMILTFRDLSTGQIHKVKLVLSQWQESYIEFDGKRLPHVNRLRFAISLEAGRPPQIELELGMSVIPNQGGDSP